MRRKRSERPEERMDDDDVAVVDDDDDDDDDDESNDDDDDDDFTDSIEGEDEEEGLSLWGGDTIDVETEDWREFGESLPFFLVSSS